MIAGQLQAVESRPTRSALLVYLSALGRVVRHMRPQALKLLLNALRLRLSLGRARA